MKTSFTRIVILLFTTIAACLPSNKQTNNLPQVCQLTDGCRGILEVMASPIQVNTFQGTIRIRSALQEDPLPGVTVEVFGPGNSTIRYSTESDAKGNFKIRNLAPGTYAYHVGKMGFNSRIGTLIVSKDAHSKHVAIELSFAT